MPRIGEPAGRSGTTTKTLRFYEQAGLLPEPERTPSGYRNYDEGVLDRLAFVRAAQAAGLSLAEIREVIAVRDHTGPPCEHVAALLDAHAADLDARIAESPLCATTSGACASGPAPRPGRVPAGLVCQVIPTG
jgi:MerR family copper efflux transcriptional regulator